VDYCYFVGVHSYAFAAAVDPTGAGAQNIAPTAYTQFPPSDVARFAHMPAGNLAVLSAGKGNCSDHGAPGLVALGTLTFGSTPAPALDPARPAVALESFAVDSLGRFIGLTGPGEWTGDYPPPGKIIRLLPNGDFDPSFGSNGGLPLKKFGEESVNGLVVDSKNRPVVGGELSDGHKFAFVRLGTKGKIDHSFGKGGWVEVGVGPHTSGALEAMAADPQGRIVAAGRVTSSALKTGEGVFLTRILPGS
jgi:hypothetical protein